MVTKDDVLKALAAVIDPELGINIVDLGLIYDVAIEGSTVSVKMTMTARGCPLYSFMTESAQKAIAALPGVTEAKVECVWEPAWTPDRMSDAAKKQLGFM